MYSEEEIKRLMEEEDELTEEELLVLLAALHTTLSELENELRLFYQKYGKDGVVTYAEAKKWVSSTNHLRRMVFLNQGIADIFASGFDEFNKVFENHLRDVILKEAQFFGVTLDVDDILNTVWSVDGLSYSQRLLAYQKKWLAVINNDLKLSVLKQDSILDVLGKSAKRGESMEYVLKRLWRTESSAMSSLARYEIYKQTGVTHFRFIHIDKCHCEMCSSLDGQVFPLSEYKAGFTANPLHPNCRDTTESVEFANKW